MFLFALACVAPPRSQPLAVPIQEVRHVRVRAPSAWDGESPIPVVVLLHGLGSHADQQDRYLRLAGRVPEQEFMLIAPDALPRAKDGKRAWNATDFCCTEPGEHDDVAFLSGLLDEVEPLAESVHFFGHSNGAFMANRMACEDDRVDGIAALAGGTWDDPGDCRLDRPVDVLVIHGNEDETVPYEGLQGNYPGAVELVERWSTRAGCTTTDTETPRNLLLGHGMETYVQNWMCPDHRVALWTMEGVGHVPVGKKDFSRDIVAWLLEGER